MATAMVIQVAMVKPRNHRPFQRLEQAAFF
jgi:hypothetical protein